MLVAPSISVLTAYLPEYGSISPELDPAVFTKRAEYYERLVLFKTFGWRTRYLETRWGASGLFRIRELID